MKIWTVNYIPSMNKTGLQNYLSFNISTHEIHIAVKHGGLYIEPQSFASNRQLI